MKLTKGLKSKLALTTAVVAMFASYGRRAYAGSCTPTTGAAVLCSGAADSGTDSEQIITVTGSGTVTTSPGFGILTGAPALKIYGAGTSLTFTDANSSSITSDQSALLIYNNGAGATSVTTTGDVTGRNYVGIFANNSSTASGLTINTSGNVTGGEAGIIAGNYGTGATSITTTGAVAGTSGYGILASNGTTATDMTINTADVTGGTSGIYASNQGTGATNITTTGTVTGTSKYGIHVKNTNAAVGSLTVTTQGEVDGGTSGILAFNYGAGPVEITANGPVSASAGMGVGVYNQGTGNTTIAVQAVTATGPVTGVVPFGVQAVNKRSDGGDLTITTNGPVVSTANAIQAQSASLAGDLNITSNDTVTSLQGVGINAVLGALVTPGAGNIVVTTHDAVSGVNGGIGIIGATTGITSVTTYGTVLATGSQSIGVGAIGLGDVRVDTKGEVTGGLYGIEASGLAGKPFGGTSATITVNAEGNVSATGPSGSGILVRAELTVSRVDVTTHGTVAGTNAGILSQNIENTGTTQTTLNVMSGSKVEGGVAGVVLYADTAQAVTIDNAGTIQNLSGASNAVAIDSNQDTGGGAPSQVSTSVTNTGLVLGTVNLAGSGANQFNNQSGGVWNTAGGTNDFGTDTTNNSITNEAGGTIVAAASGASGPTATSFSGLGTFTNGGLLQMQNGVVGDTTTIAGNFVGTGGTVSLDTQLGGDGSPTDRLIINGDASGSTALAIRNAGGAGAQTTNGIEVVEINGGTSTADAFHLASAVAVGAYDYALYYQDLTKDDQNWYLRSTGQANASAQTALPYADILVNFADATLGTLQQRTGNRIWPNGTPQVAADLPSSQVMKYAATGPVIYGQGAWGRIGGQYTSIDPKSGTPYTLSLGFLQAGYEGTAYETGAGDLTVGAYAMVGTSHADIDVSRDPATGAARSGKITTTGYGLGGNLTWLGADGLYADAVGQLTFYESSLSNKAGGDNQGWSGTASLEIGKRFELGSGWSVVPQAQLAYTHVDFDSFTDINSSRVTLGDGDSLRGRLGLRVENNASWKNGEGKTDRLQIYGIANLSYGFLKDTSVVVAGTSLEQQDKRLWGEIGAGGTYAWNDNWSVYGEADYATALSGSGSNYSLRGTAGLRYRW